NLGRTSTNNTPANNNGAIQNRNAQRDNAFAHSQNRPVGVQGGSNANQSFANRPPSNAARPQQFNTQHSAVNNTTQSNARQSVNRPSNSSAPAQHTAVNTTQNNSRQFANRP